MAFANCDVDNFNPRYREVATLPSLPFIKFQNQFQSTLPRGSDKCPKTQTWIRYDFNPRYREVATAKIRNITHIIFAQSIIQTYNYPVSTNKSDFSKSTAHPTQTILVRTSRQFYVHLRFAPNAIQNFYQLFMSTTQSHFLQSILILLQN